MAEGVAKAPSDPALLLVLGPQTLLYVTTPERLYNHHAHLWVNRSLPSTQRVLLLADWHCNCSRRRHFTRLKTSFTCSSSFRKKKKSLLTPIEGSHEIQHVRTTGFRRVICAHSCHVVRNHWGCVSHETTPSTWPAWTSKTPCSRREYIHVYLNNLGDLLFEKESNYLASVSDFIYRKNIHLMIGFIYMYIECIPCKKWQKDKRC